MDTETKKHFFDLIKRNLGYEKGKFSAPKFAKRFNALEEHVQERILKLMSDEDAKLFTRRTNVIDDLRLRQLDIENSSQTSHLAGASKDMANIGEAVAGAASGNVTKVANATRKLATPRLIGRMMSSQKLLANIHKYLKDMSPEDLAEYYAKLDKKYDKLKGPAQDYSKERRAAGMAMIRNTARRGPGSLAHNMKDEEEESDAENPFIKLGTANGIKF
jgi:hypothetical protein